MRKPTEFLSRLPSSVAVLLLLGGAVAVSAQLTTPPLPQSPAVGGTAAANDVEGSDPEPAPEGLIEPADVVARAFGDPPGAKRLNRDGRLWVDRQSKRVIVDGYVAMTEGPLEMLACPTRTKEHESVVGVLAQSREMHAALLAIGAQQGTPVQFLPEFVPATGQRIRIWIMWRDPQGKIQRTDARRWVQYTGRDKHLEMDWVFAGSSFWTDPADGKTYYQADAGDMICVSNFSTALLDLPVASSQETGQLQFSAYTSRIPKQLTPVRLVLMPIPLPSDQPQPRAAGVADPDQPPEDAMLPPAKNASAVQPGEPDAAGKPAPSATKGASGDEAKKPSDAASQTSAGAKSGDRTE